MPEGSSLERTEAVAAELAARTRGLRGGRRRHELRRALRRRWTSTAWFGTTTCAVRRTMPTCGSISCTRRSARSRATTSRHSCASSCEPLAAAHGARIQVVETPPGPPVIATVTVEVYGPPHVGYERLADAAQRRARASRVERPGPWTRTTAARRRRRCCASSSTGRKPLSTKIGEAQVAQLLQTAIEGSQVAVLHHPTESHPLPSDRASAEGAAQQRRPSSSECAS